MDRRIALFACLALAAGASAAQTVPPLEHWLPENAVLVLRIGQPAALLDLAVAIQLPDAIAANRKGSTDLGNLAKLLETPDRVPQLCPLCEKRSVVKAVACAQAQAMRAAKSGDHHVRGGQGSTINLGTLHARSCCQAANGAPGAGRNRPSGS